MTILLINICKEKFHYYEFVKPVEDILRTIYLPCPAHQRSAPPASSRDNCDFFISKHFTKVSKSDLEKADKIIICGTSLKDCEFSSKENLKYFEWIKDFDKPILGICGGMQVIGLVFGGKLGKKTEIGFFREDFGKSFLSLVGKQEFFSGKKSIKPAVKEVYHLHNNFISKWGKDWEVFAGDKIVQAVKHKQKNIYCVLFHPEVRQKQLIVEFVQNG